MPVRYLVLDRVILAACDYAFCLSDLYYADVGRRYYGDIGRRDGSFDDWNAQKDGFHAWYFGEGCGEKNKNNGINFDRIDYRPELAMGRWPVNSFQMLAEKTVAQDQANLVAKGKGVRNAAFVFVLGWVDARTDGPLEQRASLWMVELEVVSW